MLREVPLLLLNPLAEEGEEELLFKKLLILLIKSPLT